MATLPTPQAVPTQDSAAAIPAKDGATSATPTALTPQPVPEVEKITGA
jgi:hypothetical protein